MAAKTFLAGDLGGTKTLLALYSEGDQGLTKHHSQRYASAEWRDQSSLEHERGLSEPGHRTGAS